MGEYDDLDFFNEKETRRNRRAIIVVTSLILIFLVIGVSAFFFIASQFGKTRNKLSNATAELDSANMFYGGVSSDLDDVAQKLNDSDAKIFWVNVTAENDKYCRLFPSQGIHFKIKCESSLAGTINVSDQTQINNSIDETLNLLRKNEKFSNVTLDGSTQYPSISQDANAITSHAQYKLTYNRWRVRSCALTFDSNIKHKISSGEEIVISRLYCDKKITFDKAGYAND
jgi:hypothetical protein